MLGTLNSTAGLPRIAAVQMASGPKVEGNLNEAGRLIAIAAEQGASLVALPENFAIMGMSEHDKVGVREEEGAGPIQAFLAASAESTPPSSVAQMIQRRTLMLEPVT